MRIQADEASLRIGQLTTFLDEEEAAFVKLSVEAERRGVKLTPNVSPRSHAWEIFGEDLGYDENGVYHPDRDQLLMPITQAIQNEAGEIEAIWARWQPFNILIATRKAAQLIHDRRRSPTPDIPSPHLGTVVAVMAAKTNEEATLLLNGLSASRTFELPPLSSARQATPGVRAILGFQAASHAMDAYLTGNVTSAMAIIDEFNEAVTG